MASRSSSLYKGSDQILNECDPCRAQGSTSGGSAYCTVCAEFMCTACEKAHKGSKASRDHKIVTGSKMPSINTKPISPIMYCEHHKTMTSDLYCVNHDVIVCGTCKITDHKKCEITGVSQQTKRTQVNDMIDKTLKEMTDLKRKYESLRDSRKADKQEVKSQIQKCRQDLQDLRKQIDDTFDKLDKKLSKEAAYMEENMTKEVENHGTIADDAVTQINDRIKSLGEWKKSKDNDVMFVGAKKSSTMKSKYGAALSTIEQEIYPIQIEFKPDDVITDVLLQLQSIGTLQTKKDLSSSIGSHVPLWDMTVENKREVDVGYKYVFDASFIANSHLVLACGRDGLKLLDEDFKVQSQLDVKSYSVAAINNQEVVITQQENQIQRVSIFPHMAVTKTVRMERKCDGVYVHQDNIYVTCHDRPGRGEVLVIDMEGRIKRRLGVSNETYMFHRPTYVAVSKDGMKVFVSDWDTSTVTCLSQQGDVIYRYTDSQLKAPAGVCVDDTSTVLVCGWESNNVHVIKNDGTKQKVLLSEKDHGVVRPQCISRRPRDGCLVVGLYNATKALIVVQVK